MRYALGFNVYHPVGDGMEGEKFYDEPVEAMKEFNQWTNARITVSLFRYDEPMNSYVEENETQIKAKGCYLK